MSDLERAREVFRNDRYATDATGIEITEVGENYAKCSLKLCDRHRNAVGGVMGGVMFTLADFVFAIASNLNGPPTVSTVSQISFLSGVKGDTLIGESRLLRDGRNVCFYEISITDELGTPVAVASISGAHLHR